MTATMKASVVIPSYNHAAFINEAVDSVLASGLEQLEVVVVDDGSSDDTLERLARYRTAPGSTRQGRPVVQIVSQENRGAHDAIARGLSLATGEILLILNSDDAFEPERLPRFVERFQAEPELALLTSYLRVVDAGGGLLGIKEGFTNLPPWPQPRPGPTLEDTGDPMLALLQTNYVSTTSNVAFRASTWQALGGLMMPLRYTHDWDLILRLAGLGTVGLVPEPLVRYRVHASNTIREGADDQAAQGLMRFEIMWTVLRHVPMITSRALAQGHDRADLERRLLVSLPRFGCEPLLAQLRLLRGAHPMPPPAYDALLDPSHPLRRQAIERLGREPVA